MLNLDRAANSVPIDNDSFIIELGPGTGVITKAIIDRGMNESQIIAIEKSPGLAKKLQRQFSLVNVLHGNAMDLNKLLGDSHKQVSVVVSSLPLLSLPKATVKIILEQIENILEPNGCYIQFTYGTKDNWHKMLTRLKKHTLKESG